MTVTTVPVRISAYDQSGNPIVGGRVTARLDKTEVGGAALVFPELTESTTDAAGVCILNLWPNALGSSSSSYRIQAYNPDGGRRCLDAQVAACWNACDGIPTETLERYYGDQGGIDAALEEASLRDHAKAVQERDDLKSLHDGRPQVVLFCHDSPWNLDFRLSPDEARSLAVSLVDAAEACDTLSRLKETA